MRLKNETKHPADHPEHHQRFPAAPSPRSEGPSACRWGPDYIREGAAVKLEEATAKRLAGFRFIPFVRAAARARESRARRKPEGG